MARFENVITRTVQASVDFSAKQYFATNNGGLATAAKAMDGIMLDNPTSGHAGAIATRGICPAAISASQTLTDGVTYLEVDTAGTLKALASGIAVAIARETLASNAAVVICSVEVLQSNAART